MICLIDSIYFLLFFIILALTGTIIYGIYKFLISDFFVEKFGFQTYELVDNNKKCTDNIWVAFAFLMNLMWLIPFYYLSIILGSLLWIHFALGIVVFWDYVLIGIFIRLKYYFYIDEEKDLSKRQYKRDYIDFGIRWGLLNSISLVLFVGVFLLSHKSIILLIIIIWFISLNTAIFPDYLNKIWIKDIRSKEGHEYYRSIFSIIGLISLYLTFIY